MFVTPVARTKFLLSSALLLVVGTVAYFVSPTSFKPAPSPDPVVNPAPSIGPSLPIKTEPAAPIDLTSAAVTVPPEPPAPRHPAHVSTYKKSVRTPLDRLNNVRSITYTFEGRATCGDEPCQGARVTAQVSIGSRFVTRQGATLTDGRYKVQVRVISSVNESADWRLEAESNDHTPVELIGRRITTEEDTHSGVITLQGALALLPR